MNELWDGKASDMKRQQVISFPSVSKSSMFSIFLLYFRIPLLCNNDMILLCLLLPLFSLDFAGDIGDVKERGSLCKRIVTRNENVL